jgi:hypothetical protein
MLDKKQASHNAQNAQHGRRHGGGGRKESHGLKRKMTQLQAGPTIFSGEKSPRELLTVEAMVDSLNHFFPFDEGPTFA